MKEQDLYEQEEKSEAKVSALIEEFDALMEREEENALSGEGLYAEFCASFGYGDGFHEVEDRMRDEEEEVQEAFELLKKKFGRYWKDEFANLCELRQVHGLHGVSHSVYSILLGELEVQLEEDLAKRIQELDEAEFTRFSRKVNACILERRKDFAYIDLSYERFDMILKTDALLELMKEEIEAKLNSKENL